MKVRHRVYINAPLSKVFSHITSSEGWCGWFAKNAYVEPRVGGDIRFEWFEFGPDLYTASDEGKVVEIVKNQSFSFTWNPGRKPTTVRLTLEPRSDGSILTVEETGYEFIEEDLDVALQVAAGWGETLTLLKFHMEAGLTYGPVPR